MNQKKLTLWLRLLAGAAGCACLLSACTGGKTVTTGALMGMASSAYRESSSVLPEASSSHEAASDEASSAGTSSAPAPAASSKEANSRVESSAPAPSSRPAAPAPSSQAEPSPPKEAPPEKEPRTIPSQEGGPQKGGSQGSKNPGYLDGLYVQPPPEDTAAEKKKVAYLTFDDGPSKQTARVLDILKEKKVTATFFVIHNGSKEAETLYKRIVEEGHQLAIHSYTHDYKKVYQSEQSFFEEYKAMQEFLQKVTGQKVSDFRFPGGSSNTVTSKERIKGIIQQFNRLGIRYYDWNVCSGDAEGKKASKQKIVDNVLKDAVKYNEPVILMHDAAPKDTTVDALPEIIDGLRKQGYTFESVNHRKDPCQHRKY